MTDPRKKVVLQDVKFVQPSDVKPGDVIHQLMVNPMADLEAKRYAANLGLFQSSIILKPELVMDVHSEEVWDEGFFPPKNVFTRITLDSGFFLNLIDDRNYFVGVIRTDPYEAEIIT